MAIEAYNILKIFFIIVAFCEAFFMGMLPVKVKRCRNSITALGIANAFAGGVFIAIALMHILPEAVETWEKYACDQQLMGEGQDPESEDTDRSKCTEPYALPYLLVVVGYTLILVLDKVLFDAHAMFHDEGHDHNDVVRKSVTRASLVVRDQLQLAAENNDFDEEGRNSLRSSQIELEKEIQKDIVQNYSQSDRQAAALKAASDQAQNNIGASYRKSSTSSNTVSNPNNHDEIKEEGNIDKQGLLHRQNSVKKLTGCRACVATLTPYVLLIGLGVHSLFEGIALGIKNDMNEVLLLTIAIVMHKGAAGMALGTSMAKTFPDNDNHVLMLLFIFALFTPIGVLVGWGVSASSPIVEVIFNCFAAGTFVYIACSEVIVEEFSAPENKYLKFVVYIIGIGFIASLSFIEPADD